MTSQRALKIIHQWKADKSLKNAMKKETVTGELIHFIYFIQYYHLILNLNKLKTNQRLDL